MDRKITHDDPDENGRCYVYYEGDDGSEIIAEFDEDIAEALVKVWNEAIDEDTALQERVNELAGHVKNTEKDGEAMEQRLAKAMKTNKNYAALLKKRAATIKSFKITVEALESLFKGRGGEIQRLKGLVEAKDALIQKYIGVMEKAGVAFLDDELDVEQERREPREGYVDRDEKLENEFDQRDFYKEV